MSERKKHIIGLCGGSGAGKGVVAGIFRLHGAKVIDCDELARKVVSVGTPALAEIFGAFGLEYRLPDGSLDRSRMAQLIYASPSARKKLEHITHPKIFDEIRKIIAVTDGVIVIDAPLLFEAGVDELCDCIVGVIADKQTRIERVTARDSISEERAKARIDAQMSDELLIQCCDYTVTNNGSLAELDESVREILKDVLPGDGK